MQFPSNNRIAWQMHLDRGESVRVKQFVSIDCAIALRAKRSKCNISKSWKYPGLFTDTIDWAKM